MKKIIGLGFSVALAASSFVLVAEAYERVELDRNRTSLQYAGPIKSVTKVLEGYRWLGQTEAMNGGVAFEAYDNPNFGKNDTVSGSALMVKATFYTYEKISKEEIMIARQSEISGFVELYGYDSPDIQLHIRVVDDNEFQAFSSAADYSQKQKLFTYTKVQRFNKSPYEDRLKSAEESGTWY